MIPYEITQLIADSETLTIEFKSDYACLSAQGLLEPVVCFANTSSGTLLIGVEDDGKITGLHKKDLKFPPTYLSAMVANRTVPPLSLDTQIINLSEVP
ncbi:AlbA family DNA-binding domain-containing protein [Trichormus azollae]|uniref:AlbA family DNA-binding domain-containing protein n=1 Tax=Trichormus azollae TaxID=1164 RepID=UPI00325ED51D